MENTNKRTNILFVDDMSVCCRIFMQGLSGKYSVHWAKTREEALNLKANRFVFKKEFFNNIEKIISEVLENEK